MEEEYQTANEWYKAHRRDLKKYRGEWIAYTNKGVISHNRDYRKMKDAINPSLSGLDYVIERIFESEFVDPVRFYPVRMRSLKSHDWQPKYEYLLRQVEIELDGHTFTALIAWAQTDFCEEILLGREVVFDLFDIEFKQADETIVFRWRSPAQEIM